MLKRVFKTLIAFTVLPVLLLAGGEFGLRLFNYGQSMRPFHAKKIEGRPCHVLNMKYFQLFMPWWPDPADPAPYEVVIPDEKPANTYRIFVLGSSAAHGWFFPDQSFGRILEAMLRERYPGAAFELYDLSYIAMNSHVMRHLAAMTPKLHPDLYLVYMGNNEVKGTVGMLHDFNMKQSFPMHWLVRAFVFTSNLRLVQAATHAIARVSGTPAALPPWQSPMDIVSLDDPRLAAVSRNYRDNLDAICQTAQQAGAAVALCTLQRNLRDYPPDVSTHKPGLSLETMQQWEAAFQEGRRLQSSGDAAGAATAYARAATLDADYAELQYRLGTCLWTMGQHEQARAAFVSAQEHNFGLLSANAQINHSIDACARENASRGVILVDSAAALTSKSPHGTPGRELFFDHVHFTYEGSYELAAAVYRQLVPNLPEWALAGAARNPEPPSLESCKERTAYSPVEALHQHEFVVNYLKSNVPNADIQYFEDIRNRLQSEIAGRAPEITLAAYEMAAQRHPESIAVRAGLCNALVDCGRTGQAEGEARAFMEQYPHLWRAHGTLASVLLRLNRKDEALVEAQFLQRNYPELPESWYQMGEILAAMERDKDALAAYSRAAAMRPGSYLFHGARARTLERMGDLAAAEQACRDAVAATPSMLTCQWLDDVLRKGDAAHRLQTWREVTERCPGVACGWQFLGRASTTAGDSPGAEAAFAKAVKLDPSLSGKGLLEELLSEGADALSANDYPRAVASLEKAAAMSGAGFEVWVKLAQAFDGAGQPERALTVCRKAVDQKPMPQEPYDVYDRLLRSHQPDTRAAVWGTVLQQFPDAPFAAFYLAQALTETGDFAGAIAAYRQAMAVDKTAVWMGTAMAALMMRQNDAAGAVEVLRNALTANPDLQGPRPLLLEALLATGQTVEAGAIAAEIRRRNEPLPGNLSDAARALLGQDRPPA